MAGIIGPDLDEQARNFRTKALEQYRRALTLEGPGGLKASGYQASGYQAVRSSTATT